MGTYPDQLERFLESEQTPYPSLQLFTDATGSIGFGGYLAGQWFHYVSPCYSDAASRGRNGNPY